MGENSERKAWMGLLARAPAADLDRLWRAVGPMPEHEWLRAPEVGAVMVRGRAGAEGAAFNLGEMVVTRCAVRLADGRVGHGHVQGRGKDHAEQAALIDALMQGDEAARLRGAVLDPLARAEAARRADRAGKAAATRVDFFTLVRGED
ncbi:phosphonate C-P lyase system protein PhnG [Roseovarius ramblicola]|uniref:Phosphonate C-P lyase system protein PhnG n=1 Tax=Roseovarius ramblicola TaxID=2022336 RepID=A0ABV5I456_9RHOB